LNEAAFFRGFSPTPRVVLRRFKAISCTRTHGGCGGGTWQMVTQSPFWIEISSKDGDVNQQFSGDDKTDFN
jgi:hypothetical protein